MCWNPPARWDWDNDAARAYERMGFVRVREEKNDIGAGFCMDDFVYRYDL